LTERLPNFHIRHIPVCGDAILSPMDGYSDLPFRRVCREAGSAMSYTEFINALDILQGHPHVHRKWQFDPAERPMVFQIFDNSPDRLLEVALRLQEHGPDIIDINMGCSAKTVSGRGAGAGLLRTPLQVARIVRRLSRALSIPLTAKIRLGWDDDTRNYRLIARIVEENGGALIAVHGRTRQQGYSGAADWDAIAEVRQAVSIPVIANGDVRRAEDIERLKTHTGCPAVMVGRGALSNPWIFSHREREAIPPQEVRRLALRHLELSQDFYGAPKGLVLFRKYASRYLSPTPLPGELRQRLLTAEDLDIFLPLLDEAIAWGAQPSAIASAA
jgi:nifR3 family TIM-barrel protein